MAVEVVANTPLAEALQNAVQPKLVEIGWSTGALDDSALSEYIILMLVNGKTQEQIATELANDLLGLSSDDPSALEFARWLFEQVDVLNAQLNGAPVSQAQSSFGAAAVQAGSSSQMDVVGTDSVPVAQDATMSDGTDGIAEGAVPTGPKSMRNGTNGAGPRSRDRRMLGQIGKAMDRTPDASLHRIRGAAGGGRVAQHSREPPRGPKNMASKVQNMMGAGRGMGGQAGMNPQMAQTMMGSTPQQQMQLLQLLEEQSRMMAQILGPGSNQPAINPAFFGAAQNGAQRSGKSLFDRVEGKPRQNGNQRNRPTRNADAMDTDTPVGTESIPNDDSKKDPSTQPCRFQLSCTSAACPYAHQSPAAPPGAAIDSSDKCSFGAACMNKKCAGSHPSPAQKRQHLSSTVDCKFYPNCTNPSCPFKHPSIPPCRNGADCPQKDTGCKFSHSTISCRYNPCLNPGCPFKHVDGQRRGKFEDKVWTAEGFDREAAEKQDQDPQQQNKQHVSERKFAAAEGDEELILPGRMETGNEAAEAQAQAQAQDAAAALPPAADIVT